MEKTSLEIGRKHKLKFKYLRVKTHGNGMLDPKRVVKNMSSRILSKDEDKVLALGFNFAVAPTTETTARQQVSEKARQLRVGVSHT